jgi:hypothetical protein
MVNELMVAGTKRVQHQRGLPSKRPVSVAIGDHGPPGESNEFDDDPRTEGSPHRVNSPGHSLLIGTLPLPSDFPVAEFIAAELEMRARAGTSPITPAPTWAEFGAAWMAVAYRFLDVTYFDQAFRDSMAKFGAAPEPPERYRQERHLFGIFVSGLSAIESFCYGLCALAWEADSRLVSLATPGQKKGERREVDLSSASRI